MKFRWQRGWGGNRGSLPYLVFILSLAATVCAWVWAGLVVGTQDADRFRSTTEEAELAIKDRIDDQEDLVRAGAATYALQGGWTRSQFHSYVDNLSLTANYRGSLGLGFIRKTSRMDLPSLEKSVRAEGEVGFKVHSAPTAEEIYPIIYLVPEDSSLPSIGFDAFSDPVRREAMVSARDQGQPTITEVIPIPAVKPGTKSQPSFIIFCPIYKGGEIPESMTDRRKSLLGFVFSRFSCNEVFHDVLEGEARKNLQIDIFDERIDKKPTWFYSSSSSVVQWQSKLGFVGPIPVAGRQWTIHYHSSPEFEQQSAGWLVDWIPIAGILVSAVLAAVSFSQVKAYRQLNKQAAQMRGLNENLEHIVQERTTELQATNQELEAFCYSVSHDLRAPLRSVDGFSKSLLEDYGDRLDEQARDYIGRVRRASHRMDELISALLNLSRITRLEIVRQPIDLSHMAHLTIEEALEGRDRTEFDVTIRKGMTVDADPKLIRVVLDNLVRNAIKFSAKQPISKIEIGLKSGSFFVRDNGVGFNPAYAEKLFVAFERLHTQTEFPGSGIGLATVQRIVHKHGGEVWAESEEGKGAVFYFTLR